MAPTKTCANCPNTFDPTDKFYSTPIGRHRSIPLDFYCAKCALEDIEEDNLEADKAFAEGRRKAKKEMENDPYFKGMDASVERARKEMNAIMSGGGKKKGKGCVVC